MNPLVNLALLLAELYGRIGKLERENAELRQSLAEKKAEHPEKPEQDERGV